MHHKTDHVLCFEIPAAGCHCRCQQWVECQLHYVTSLKMPENGCLFVENGSVLAG
jgi:hypothetical protein